MSFFNVKNPQSDPSTIYYLPIYKKIADINNRHAWVLAKDGRFNRLFYSSPEALYQAQQKEGGGSLFCYKVSLTPEQANKVAEGKDFLNGKSAALGFSAQEIISCIEFTSDSIKIEHSNRFYSPQNRPVEASTISPL